MTETKTNNLSIQWKLYHLDTGNMDKLISLVDGMKITEKDIDKIPNPCEVCFQSKQTGAST